MKGSVLAGRTAAWKLYGLVTGIWLIYFWFDLHAPLSASAKRLGLSTASRNLVRLPILILLLVVWLLAASTFIKLRRYAKSIGGSADGRAFSKLAAGFGLLGLGLMVPQFFSHISAMRSYFSLFPWLATPVRLGTNYAFVFCIVSAFYFLFVGTRDLLRTFNITPNYARMLPTFLGVAAYGVLYSRIIFTDPFRRLSPDNTVGATYYLPDVLIVLTVMLPFMVALCFSVLAIANLLALQKSPGIIYQAAMKKFLTGAIVVIIANVLMQTLLSVGVTRYIKLGLMRVLIVIYISLLVPVVAYLLLHKGAQELTKIETATAKQNHAKA